MHRLKVWNTARCSSLLQPRSEHQRVGAGPLRPPRPPMTPPIRPTPPSASRPPAVTRDMAPMDSISGQYATRIRPDRHFEYGRIDISQHPHANRRAYTSAEYKGHEALSIETATERAKREQLPDQRTEHHQGAGNLRRDNPHPERHRHQAEGKPRKPLHETRGQRANQDVKCQRAHLPDTLPWP